MFLNEKEASVNIVLRRSCLHMLSHSHSGCEWARQRAMLAFTSLFTNGTGAARTTRKSSETEWNTTEQSRTEPVAAYKWWAAYWCEYWRVVVDIFDNDGEGRVRVPPRPLSCVVGRSNSHRRVPVAMRVCEEGEGGSEGCNTSSAWLSSALVSVNSKVLVNERVVKR